MTTLREALAGRQRRRYTIVHAGEAAPEGRPDAVLLARDGVYVRGSSADLDIVIPIGPTPPLPGLAALAPAVTFQGLGPAARLPGHLLDLALEAARGACDAAGRWIEWLGFVVLDEADGRPTLAAPAVTAASASRVVTAWPAGALVDIHSHHTLPAYFSATDDADDAWLSVSVVIGEIDHRYPAVCCRLNVYGHHLIVPATMIFDGVSRSWRDGGADTPVAGGADDYDWFAGLPIGAPASRLVAALAAALASRRGRPIGARRGGRPW
jgi:PRTRC genetic system protein A